MARSDRERRRAAFERRDALFEHRVGRVADARIDIAEGLKPEERRRVVDIVEDEGRRLIDRRRARAGGRIGLGAGMNGKRRKSRLAAVHILDPSAVYENEGFVYWTRGMRQAYSMRPAKETKMFELSGFFTGTEMPDANWWEALWPDPAGVLTATGLKLGTNAVDLCCGDGWFTLPMAKAARHATAIDIDGRMLGLARLRLEQQKITNCDFVEGEIGMHFRPHQIARGFYFPRQCLSWRSRQAALYSRGRCGAVAGRAVCRCELARARAGRNDILGYAARPEDGMRMSPEQTIASAKSPGLKFMEVVDVPPYHYGVVWERV